MAGKQSDLTYQPALVDVSLEWKNSALVSEQLVDVLPVELESDTFYYFTASGAFEQWDDTVEEDGIVPEVKHRKGTMTYQVEDHGLREAVNEKSREKQALIGFDELADITELVSGNIDLNHEMRVASLLTTSGNHLASHVMTAGAGASPAKWTAALGDPFKDLGTIFDTLLGIGTGEVRICFSQTAWRNLSNNANARAAFNPTSPAAILSPAMVEQHLQSSLYPNLKILIAGGWKHTGAPLLDESNMSLSRIWGDNVVFHVAPLGGPGKRKPAGAYTFRQKTRGMTRAVYTYLQNEKGGHGSTWVQVAQDDVTKVVGKSYLGLITATS